MYTKIKRIIFSLLIFNMLVGQVSNLPRNKNSNKVKTRELDLLNECTLPSNENGFCVQAQNCNMRYAKVNETFIDEISCGPRNQNRKRPYVCCEPSDIVDTEQIDYQSSNTIISETFNSKMCGNYNQLSSRIVGGEETESGEFPWLVRLMRVSEDGYSKFSCTGALISPRVVITTAHCIDSPGLSQLGKLHAVHLGEHEIECKFGKKDCLQNQKVVNVSKFITHPNYRAGSKNLRHDVGLVILKEKVEFTSYISPICLLEEAYEPLYFVVSGWGKTETGTTSRIKLKTTLMPFSWQQCVDKYATLNIAITQSQFCAGGVRNQDSCQGDSGGPLMVLKNNSRWYAAGIVSFGVRCGTEGWPGVYTNIPSYIEWIRNEMSRIAV